MQFEAKCALSFSTFKQSANNATRLVQVHASIENQTSLKPANQFVTMIIVNDSVNDVSNFVLKNPTDTCEVSNWTCFFQRFQKSHLINQTSLE